MKRMYRYIRDISTEIIDVPLPHVIKSNRVFMTGKIFFCHQFNNLHQYINTICMYIFGTVVAVGPLKWNVIYNFSYIHRWFHFLSTFFFTCDCPSIHFFGFSIFFYYFLRLFSLQFLLLLSFLFPLFLFPVFEKEKNLEKFINIFTDAHILSRLIL